jgi:hypothetical protein
LLSNPGPSHFPEIETPKATVTDMALQFGQGIAMSKKIENIDKDQK